MPVIDVHVHIYAPEVIADPDGWAQSRGENHWAELVKPPIARPAIQGWATLDILLEDMRRDGVDRAILLGWYWENHATCLEQNRWYEEWCGRHGDRLSWFAAVQPAAGEKAVEEARRALAAGAIGIGELSPAGQGISLRDPRFIALAEVAVEYDAPINIHVNEALGRERPGRRFDKLDDFQWLARELPQLKLILAHWGGLIPFFELNRAVRRDLRNVFYDTAASPLLYDSRVFCLASDVIGAEKILFGTDYPLLPFPRLDGTPGFKRMADEVRGSGLTMEELRLVLGENARRLLRLP